MAVDRPIGGRPIFLSPATFARFGGAFRYIETVNRTRDPRRGSQRWPGVTPGAWGKLAAGASITAASGLTLGSGTVTLCSRSGTVPSPPETVSVANAGAAISGGTTGKVLPLEWTAGEWSVCGCSAGIVPTCRLNWTVTGCAGARVPGATIAVWNSSAKTTSYGTAIDDGGGNYHLLVSAAGSFYWEVTATRFRLGTGSGVLFCNNTAAVSLSPATGYVCLSSGAYPISTTLHTYDPFFGISATLNYNASTGIWESAPITVAFPGSSSSALCIACPAASTTLIYRWAFGSAWVDFTTATGCPASGPYHAVTPSSWIGPPCTGSPGHGGTANTMTGYIPGVSAFSSTSDVGKQVAYFDPSGAACIASSPYCGAPNILTTTE